MRPISLLNISLRCTDIFDHCSNDQITDIFKDTGESVNDNIFELSQILDDCNIFAIPIYFLFIY